MANQKTPSTDTVELDSREKIILSGAMMSTSILGHGAHVISAAAAPSFYRDPIISGSLVAPSILYCEAESFTSSPRATITYQWKRETVDITDETSQTFQTALSGIGDDITCEVTITNASGNDVGVSNILTLEAIIPSPVFQFDAYAIQGLNSYGRIDVNNQDISVISGLEHPMKIDVNEMDAYLVTGFTNANKIDLNEMDPYIITGTGCEDKVDIMEGGCYAMFLPVFLNALTVINGDAEDTDMTDWTMDIGNVTSVVTAPGWGIDDYRTGRFFKADDLGQGVDSQMSQIMLIDAGDYTAVDLGRCLAVCRFKFYAERHYDKLTVTLKAMSASDSILATKVFDVPAYENVGGFSNQGWLTHSSGHDPLLMPTLTRKVKVTILFEASASGSAGNNAYCDNVLVDIYEIE